MNVRIALAAVLALALGAGLQGQQLQIHYINVGWGSSVLVIGPDGTTVLMEAGDTGMGTNRVVPYLQSIGIPPTDGLDYTIVGHQHCDHNGGMDEVIAAGYDVRVRNYFNGSASGSTNSCNVGWKNSARNNTTAGYLRVMQPGTQIDLGNGATLTCLARRGKIIGSSTTMTLTNENDKSIAVLIKYGGFDYLWASDLGGGNIDRSCTGRSTTQKDVETRVINAILPTGNHPLITEGGIDVLNVNHHGSESSTNTNWFNHSSPALAVIPTGAGQSSTWQLPRWDVVNNVLNANASDCVTAPATFILQTEEGHPIGSDTSRTGFCVGNITITTDGQTTFTVDADGMVSQRTQRTNQRRPPQGLPPRRPMTETITSGCTAGASFPALVHARRAR